MALKWDGFVVIGKGCCSYLSCCSSLCCHRTSHGIFSTTACLVPWQMIRNWWCESRLLYFLLVSVSLAAQMEYPADGRTRQTELSNHMVSGLLLPCQCWYKTYKTFHHGSPGPPVVLRLNDQVSQCTSELLQINNHTAAAISQAVHCVHAVKDTTHNLQCLHYGHFWLIRTVYFFSSLNMTESPWTCSSPCVHSSVMQPCSWDVRSSNTSKATQVFQAHSAEVSKEIVSENMLILGLLVIDCNLCLGQTVFVWNIVHYNF